MKKASTPTTENQPSDNYTITRFDTGSGNLNKQFDSVNGELEKTSNTLLSSGKYSTHNISSPAALKDFLNKLKPNQAVSIGISNKENKGKITTRAKADDNTISRTKENFNFSNCFLLDVDGSNLKYDEILPLLISVDSSLKDAPILLRGSSSHGVHLTGSKPKEDGNGYHVWIGGVTGDIARYGEVFSKRLWLAGHGKIVISKSGRMLVRQTIDSTVFSPERLIYEAPPTLGEGVEAGESFELVQMGVNFNADALPELTDAESSEYEEAIRKAKQLAVPSASIIKQDYVDKHVALMVDGGTDEKTAREHVTASLLSGDLYGSQQLHFKEFGAVTVADVIADPARFDEGTLADPLEPNYNNSQTVAKFFADSMIVHSFAHGPKSYRLKPEPPEPTSKDALSLRVMLAIDTTELDAGNISEWLHGLNLSSKTVEDILMNLAIKHTKAGQIKTAVRKDLKSLRIKEASQQRNEASSTTVKVQHNRERSLDPIYFPHVRFDGEKASLQATRGNLQTLLNGYGIGVSYDVIAKKQHLGISGSFNTDLEGNAKLAEIDSLCGLNDLPMKCSSYLPTIFSQNAFNPVTDYMEQLVWDDQDHIGKLQSMIKVTEQAQPLWDIALKRWLIQCVAAADNAEQTPNTDAKRTFEYCLVFIGEQGLEKTSLIENLMPTELHKYFKEGVLLNPSNKDSVSQAISNWIVELGELDSTFSRSDNAQIKAFFSTRKDVFRLPYDRVESHYQRRTAFFGTVNDRKFLTDKTGSRRFWPIEVTSIPTRANLNLDVSQLWAQVWTLYLNGEQWWACPVMNELVSELGKEHATDNHYEDALLMEFDLVRSAREKGEFYISARLPPVLNLPIEQNVSREIRTALKSYGIEKAMNGSGDRGYYLFPRHTFNAI